MRFVCVAVLFATCFVYSISAVPLDAGYQQPEPEDGGSRIWTALKNFFSPIYVWFRKELPNKTPTDLATDIKETAVSAKEWADNNPVIQSAKEAVKPLQTWLTDTANTLKDKTFGDMFSDAKDAAKRVDQATGEWIDTNLNELQ